MTSRAGQKKLQTHAKPALNHAEDAEENGEDAEGNHPRVLFPFLRVLRVIDPSGPTRREASYRASQSKSTGRHPSPSTASAPT
jgi:hypothetical protein